MLRQRNDALPPAFYTAVMKAMPLHARTAVYATADLARARVLRAYLAAGLVFMLVPGTLLGVMNLIQISGRESGALVSAAWIQAHGHAQVFGWIGTFMLGIGFYSIPTGHRRTGFASAWIAWTLWITGVTARWIANVQGWEWRILLPASSLFELAAFVIFVRVVGGHRAGDVNGGAPGSSRMWMAGVITGTAGWIAALSVNVAAAFSLATHSGSPALPHALDQRLLTLLAWGVFAPFIWGFSARWLPVLLGLDAFRPRALSAAIAAAVAGVVLTFAGAGGAATMVFVLAGALAIAALRLFERPSRPARTRGIDARFPLFIRVAYAWLLVAAILGVAAARWDTSGGIWGASRHAFTVGFTAAMVFLIGQRMLPGFAGHKTLWSTRLMFLSLFFLMTGCLLRVSAEVLAYQDIAAWAWPVLPVSAVFELTAVSAFAVNMYRTLWW
jgi:hypothetical protein